MLRCHAPVPLRLSTLEVGGAERGASPFVPLRLRGEFGVGLFLALETRLDRSLEGWGRGSGLSPSALLPGAGCFSDPPPIGAKCTSFSSHLT